jgi:hypothetical protein
LSWKNDVTLNPVDAGLLSADGLMLGSNSIPDAVEQFVFAGFGQNPPPLVFFVLLVYTEFKLAADSGLESCAPCAQVSQVLAKAMCFITCPKEGYGEKLLRKIPHGGLIG